MSRDETTDLIVVGAGAAGLATAIFAARARGGLRVRCLDGARHVGAKILVSGGARCNVTNRDVTERDFWGGSPHAVRAVLRAFPAARAAEFFTSLGVPLHEEEDGKLFPDTNRARTVLDALMRECDRLGIEVRCGARVTDVRRGDGTFVVAAGESELRARHVALATGGRSLPKSGSDGFGYELAKRLGHGYVQTTPALVPLLLGQDYRTLAGVSHEASLTVTFGSSRQFRGPLLWTHFGASGPVVLNASRHWLRARVEGGAPRLVLNVMPDHTFESLERWWLQAVRDRPRATIGRVLSGELPASVAGVWLQQAGVDPATPLSQLPRDARRTLVRALVATDLDVSGSRGYTYAEVTAGGVPLDEIDPATMESRKCEGLYLTGEVLDVDGRLGGFNFQWAWSSGYVAGTAAAKA
jgi:predicted Rossmann fold flavoprotein